MAMENSAQESKSLFGKALPILILIMVALAVAKYFQLKNAERPKPRPLTEEVLPADDNLLPPRDAAQREPGEAAGTDEETGEETGEETDKGVG